jgi:hypothetical protein
MTLGDLLRKTREVGNGFNTYEIPLMKDGLHVKFDLEAQGSNKDGWHIEITNYKEGEE